VADDTPRIKEFLVGVTSGVVGLMFSIAIPLALVAFMPGGALGLLRAFAPSLF